MSTPPRNHKALTLIQDHPDRFARQGAVVPSYRTYHGRRLGPYYRLTWREDGRQRSIYLGRQGPVVRQVRLLLHQAHTIRRMKREHRRNVASFREHVIRPLKQYIEHMFLLFGGGLYIKGSEIRGIRHAGPRPTVADVPEHLVPKFPLPLPLAQLWPQHHTNPIRDQEQATPPLHTNPKREQGQETPPLHTNPKREPEQRPHLHTNRSSLTAQSSRLTAQSSRLIAQGS